MLLSFTCAQCQSELEADASLSGTQVECPRCGEPARVPIPRIKPGTTLGNFHIDRQIGSGGMGDVFLATQISMSRQVALKVLPQALTRNSGILERFLHEVRLSARLEHPHIVTAFEAGEDHGYYYLAMSYVEGEQLGDYLKTHGALPEEKALRITRQVAEALAYAWDTFRILHRDIKPSNIMLDRSGNAKLMDMGISKSLVEEDAGLTISGTLVGTPHYMSPEQAREAADIDFRSDMYSLGATLYHLVTGTTPYSGATTVEVLRQLALEEFPSPRERNKNLSEGCCLLLEVMMAREPKDRHASWQDLIGDVDRVLAGQLPERQPSGKRRAANASSPTKAGAAVPAETSPPPPRTPPPTRAPAQRKSMPPVIDLRRNRRRWLLVHGLKLIVLFGCLVAVGAALFVGIRKSGMFAKVKQNAKAMLEKKSLPSLRASAPATAADDAEAPPETTTAESLSASSAAALPAPDPAAAPDAKTRNEPDSAPAPPVESPKSREKSPEDLVAGRRLRHFLDGLAANLLAGDREAVAEKIHMALADPALTSGEQARILQSIALLVRRAKPAAMRTLLKSFQDDLGKIVPVHLRDGGTVPVSIRRIESPKIIGTRMNKNHRVALGRIEFSLGDLAVEEWLRRLEPAAQRPPVALALGILCVENGKSNQARKYFRCLPPELRDALLRCLDRKGAKTSGESLSPSGRKRRKSKFVYGGQGNRATRRQAPW